jgi:hypothetical protein
MGTAVFARRRPKRAPGDALIALAVVAVALAAALFTATKGPELAGGNALLLTPFVAIPVWMFLTDRPALALAVLLAYLGLVDGYLKLKIGSEGPTLGRDLLLYALAVGMLLRAVVRREPLDLPPLTLWIGAFVVVVLVQLLNPANQGWGHSVASLRQHIEFVPLFFIAYTVMRSKDRLRLFFLLLLGVTCVNAGVALVQFNMSPDQLAGWGPGYSDLINGEGAAPRTASNEDGEKTVRPPGLGSDMGFAGNLGAVALPGALALLALGRFNRRQAILAAVMTPGAVIAIVTSQSRSVVVVGVVAVVVFALLALLAGQALRLMLAALAVGILALSAVSFVGNQSGDGAFYRYSSVAPSELFGTTVDARSHTIAEIPNYARKFPLGAGIGSVGPAAGFLGTARPLNAESQFTFMIVEIGVLGLLVFIGFQARLLGLVLSRLRRVRDDEARLLLVALVTPLIEFIALWIIGVTTTSTPSAPYIWFAGGAAVWWLVRRETEPDRMPVPTRTPAPPARTPVHA